MNYDPITIEILIRDALDHANLSLDTRDFEELTQKVNDVAKDIVIAKRYVYKKFNEARKAIEKDEASIGMRESYVNLIAQYLGHHDFKAYKLFKAQPVDPILQSCLGNWYSIVRANSGMPYLLIAPVEIRESRGSYTMELRGGSRLFKGRVERKREVIYCTLDSDPDKLLNLVFRIGYAHNPALLMGVFSGVSTGGDPIAGRELLLRTEMKYEDMTPIEVPLKREDQWPSWIDKRIFRYFSVLERNCLKASHGVRFSLDDLDISE